MARLNSLTTSLELKLQKQDVADAERSTRTGTAVNEGADTTPSGDVAAPDMVNDDEGPSASKLNSNEPLSGLVTANVAPELRAMIDETARA